MLDTDRWRRADEILEAALELPSNDRQDYIDEQSQGDHELKDLVEALLEAVDQETELMQPGGALAGPVGRKLVDVAGRAGVLQAGARVGRYEIVGLLGTGGMGEVYRARDPQLEREVAIKTLPEDFARNTERLRRFEREAKLLAALNHPNIAAIYGVEAADGHPFLVLELVEGETLQELVRRGPVPGERAVEIAVQLAEACEEAHHKTIVHRDLKPSNVKITPSGRVKVLDFGLATFERPEPSPTSHDSAVTTKAGVILGTAAYMSPEQARSQAVDKRSDIWAFGCLLFEMLSGRRAFPGNSAPDTLAAVLTREVDWQALPRETPDVVRRLLKHCLNKDLRQRLQDIGDARVVLSEVLEDRSGARTALTTSPAWRAAPWLITGLALLGLALTYRVAAPPPVPTARVVRFVVDMPPDVRLSGDYSRNFALSPDGSRIVYVGEDSDGVRRLYVRALDGVEATPVPGTEDARHPFFSPDGSRIAFFAERKLKRVGLSGDSPATLAEVGGNPRGGTWSPLGSIVFPLSQTSGLERMPASGGALEPLTQLDTAAGERSHRWPQLLPGGKRVLFTVQREGESFDEASLAVVSLEDGSRKTVWRGGSHGYYLESGHLVYVRGGQVLAVAFDLSTLKAAGAPRVVVRGVRYGRPNGGSQFAVSADGTLAYVPDEPDSGEGRLVFVDEQGEFEPILEGRRAFDQPRLSPDGRHIAVRIRSATGSDPWLLDVQNRTLSKLGLESPGAVWPIWNPSGDVVTVAAPDGAGWQLVSTPLSAQSPSVTLYRSEHRVHPSAWSPDGRTLVFQERHPEHGWDLRQLRLDPANGPQVTSLAGLASPRNEFHADLSPDGRWLAYETEDVDSVVQIYVRSFPGPGVAVQISHDGGRRPRWRQSGDVGQLVYWRSGTSRLAVVPYRVSGQLFTVDPERPAWPRSGAATVESRLVAPTEAAYDVAREDPRVIMLERSASRDERPTELVVAVGWLAFSRSQNRFP